MKIQHVIAELFRERYPRMCVSMCVCVCVREREIVFLILVISVVL